MDFVKDLGRKKESKKLSHIENKNIIENYNSLVEKYNEINGFSQDVVEKHNLLVEKYNQLAEDSETEKRRYEEELRLQKDVNAQDRRQVFRASKTCGQASRII